MARWLLLAYHLPSHPSHMRVKTWRRLQQIGAVSTKNSVYVLPNTEPCREDFEWIRSEIVALGGEATVFAADSLAPSGGEDIVSAFHRARTDDYRELTRGLERVMPRAMSRRALTPTARRRLGRIARTTSERLGVLDQINFFGAPARQDVVKALAALDRLIADRARETLAATEPPLEPSAFHHRRWVTRPRPGVDRIASAWLIRRFIDPKAAFGFVDTPGKSDVPFDMYTGAFSHQGSLCTFETLAHRFRLSDPVVVRIGHIVHDLDMKESRYAPAEAAAVGRLVDGLRHVHADDRALLEQGITMFEALARSFAATSPDRTPAPRVPAAKRAKRRARRRD